MKQLAVIGSGMRANAYLTWLGAVTNDWRLSAVADPNPTHRQVFTDRYGDSRTLHFESGPELLSETGDTIDGVIIASPNNRHLESAIPAFALGIPVMLEKPVATNRDECAKLWEAYAAGGRPPVMVGFVLRYARFYRKLAELVHGGAVGDILSISAAELMGPKLSALFMRGWRRNSEIAGPLINEKCSHDLDLLTMLTGEIPTRVASFAGHTRFLPRPGAGATCGECAIRAECSYDASTLPEYSLLPRSASAKDPVPMNDRCVFSDDISIPDHQVVVMEYPGGITTNFTMTMDQPRTTRTITICGTNGQINGVFEDDSITVEQYDAGIVSTDRVSFHHDESAHGGGDSAIAAQFRALLNGGVGGGEAGLEQGIQACLIGFAAEESRLNGTIAEVEQVGNW